MCITISDWIGISQAVILLLTGGVVVWYTIETARIRKETSIQNTLLAEQLRIMQASIQHDIEKEISFIRPFFVFGGGQHSTDHSALEFENKGGAAYKLSTKSLESFSVSVSPTKILETNGKGRINFTFPSNSSQSTKYPFELHCVDKLGNPHLFHLYYLHYKGVFEEEQK
jgi:hypothetical protein